MQLLFKREIDVALVTYYYADVVYCCESDSHTQQSKNPTAPMCLKGALLDPLFEPVMHESQKGTNLSLESDLIWMYYPIETCLCIKQILTLLSMCLLHDTFE